MGIVMDLAKGFRLFCEDINLDASDMYTTRDEIAIKLNKEYYGLDGESEEHMYTVGSVGRNTAIKGNSDLDLIFDMPVDVFEKYDSYSSNGQSALLQDIKEKLQVKYSRTKLRGDGQVVVIEFQKYTVEIVPGFIQSDNSFIYPDTHDGGSWMRTNPLKEQRECKRANEYSDGTYNDFCHLIRAWKNNLGIEFSGLLIDTLIYQHFYNTGFYPDKSYKDYYVLLLGVMNYLRNCDETQAFWLAPGSYDKVYDKGKNRFVGKAQEAYLILEDGIDDADIEGALVSLFGKGILYEVDVRNNSTYDCNTEEFIEDKYPVDIRYSLRLDCRITQDGFRPFFLTEWLTKNRWLKHHKSLDFFIKDTNCPGDYKIVWKVRNVGRVAEERRMIRGQLLCTNNTHRKETTDFYGPHYVECYLVKNGVCVAKDRIDVPIGEE